MTGKLFNHMVRSDIIPPDLPGVTTGLYRYTEVDYDDILGRRRMALVNQPADMYDDVKIGGSMSVGATTKVGWIKSINNGIYIVNISGEMISCASPLTEAFLVGSAVVVFDYMNHEDGHYGEFQKGITSHADLEFGLHSINIILLKDSEIQRTIRVDPYSGYINTDEL